LGRDKESPLPSLMPAAKVNPPPSKVAPPVTKPTNPKATPPALNKSLVGATATVGADEAFEFSDEDDIESSIEENKRAANIDFAKFDYKKTDLNKLGDAELKAHKAAMEVKF